MRSYRAVGFETAWKRSTHAMPRKRGKKVRRLRPSGLRYRLDLVARAIDRGLDPAALEEAHGPERQQPLDAAPDQKPPIGLYSARRSPVSTS